MYKRKQKQEDPLTPTIHIGNRRIKEMLDEAKAEGPMEGLVSSSTSEFLNL